MGAAAPRTGARAQDLTPGMTADIWVPTSSRNTGLAARAVGQAANYVSILMGARDLCTPSVEWMTPVATFRSEFQQALGTPDSRVTPTITHLYQQHSRRLPAPEHLPHELHGTVPVGRRGHLSIVTVPDRTNQERNQVRERKMAFTRCFRRSVRSRSKCRFDGNAVFRYQFSRSDVTMLDYFHPLTGQSHLAALTWSTNWWS